MTAREYMGERGVSVRNARFAGDYVAVRDSVDNLVEHCAYQDKSWRPPNGARLYVLWTRCACTESYADAWTMRRAAGWMYSTAQFPSAEDFTGNFKTEAQALAEAARITKEESDRFDAQQQEQLAATRAKA